MNDIQEYRIASAEWLVQDKNNQMYRTNWTSAYNFPLWNPEADLNQQGMIEDELIRQGCETYCSIQRTSLTKTVQYDYRITNDETGNRAMNISQESKSTAFRLAFMKYYETLKNK